MAMTLSKAKETYFNKVVMITQAPSSNPPLRKINECQGVPCHLMWWRVVAMRPQGGKPVLTLAPIYFPSNPVRIEVYHNEVYRVEDSLPESEALNLTRVKLMMWEYNKALDNREHGGVAADRALKGIAELLGMSWTQGCTKQP